MLSRRSSWLVLVLAGCGATGSTSASPEPPRDTRTPEPAPVSAPPEAVLAPKTVAEASAPEACGAHGCLRFASPVAAFEHVLAENPAVLAVGEMHALTGSESIASPTRRFTADLLPRLVGRASDLVLELWVADPGCEREVAKVDQAQAEVRQGQAPENQNEHVALGDEAKRLGIQPHVLAPTCDDYAAIAAAGDDDVVLMLQTIARLTTDKAAGLVAQNRARGANRVVVCYGGAIHNDLVPAKGAATFSFGPVLAERVGGRYVALDLVVPELVQDTKLWRTQSWHAEYDPTAHPNETLLYHPHPGEYALIFPRSTPAP